jgi:Na+/glutamate symporter
MYSILSLLLILFFIKLGEKIEHKFKSHLYFVSVPYTAGILFTAATYFVYLIFDFPIFVPEWSKRVLVTVFLFTIGYQMAVVYVKKHWQRMIGFLFICALLLVGLKMLSSAFINFNKWLLGPIMFGYNNELLVRLVPFYYHEEVHFWSSIQMGVVFLLTPLF